VPDFRAGERAFQLLWSAAEAVGAGGRLVVQTLHPDHYALTAVRSQNRDAFYRQELPFRFELGYPPFRRFCHVSARGKTAAGAKALIEEAAGALADIEGLTVYPAMALGTGPLRRRACGP
jgi:primosomal protein N' (replication factor Y)